MKPLAPAFVVVALAVAASCVACANGVDDGNPRSTREYQHGSAGWAGSRANDASSDASSSPSGSDPSASDPSASDPSASDPNASDPASSADPGADDHPDSAPDVVPDGPSGIPADAGDSCVAASDCAPSTSTEIPGFACASGVCACDDGNVSSCGANGGTWSSFECACFMNTESAMPAASPETPGEADAGVTCWWKYKDTGCDDPTWVDTSYYEYTCDTPDDCYERYVEDGYYEDGACHGRWVKRCDDGNEYW